MSWPLVWYSQCVFCCFWLKVQIPGCVDRTVPLPPRHLYPNPPKHVNMSLYLSKGTLKIWLRILKWGDYPRLSARALCHFFFSFTPAIWTLRPRTSGPQPSSLWPRSPGPPVPSSSFFLRRERGDRGVREGGVRLGKELIVMLYYGPKTLGSL